MTTYPELNRYLQAFVAFDPRGVLRAALLNVTAASLEGIGLLMLVPLLGLAGVIQPVGVDLPAWLAPLSDRLMPLEPDQRLTGMLALFVLLIALQSVLMLLRDRQAQSLQLRFVDHLRTALYRGIASARWSFLAQHHSSEFVSVLTSDLQRVGVGTQFLLQIFTTLAMFAVYLVVAFQLSAPMTVLALLTGSSLWLLLRRSKTAASRMGSRLTQAHQALLTQTQEFLTALKLIKIHGEEENHVRQILRAADQLRVQQTAFQNLRTRAQSLYRIGGALVLSALTYAALMRIQLPTAHLLVMIGIFARMLPQLSVVHGGLQQLSHMLPAFAHWEDWVRRCRDHADPPFKECDGQTLLRDALVFSDVTYRHPKGHQTLRIPNLVIPARKTTAIIGPTGSGKTSLLDLISGLTPPDTGVILADGEPLATRSGWRGRIAYVLQESTLFDGTVRENLTWGNPRSDDEAVGRVLEQAAAAFVHSLPMGLDTTVGERGVRLSGGERQRLALARALLRNPELLVLDEATNALDRESQQAIFSAIRNLHGQLTVLIVTHRHEEIADLIDGRVFVRHGLVSPWIDKV